LLKRRLTNKGHFHTGISNSTKRVLCNKLKETDKSVAVVLFSQLGEDSLYFVEKILTKLFRNKTEEDRIMCSHHSTQFTVTEAEMCKFQMSSKLSDAVINFGMSLLQYTDEQASETFLIC